MARMTLRSRFLVLPAFVAAAAFLAAPAAAQQDLSAVEVTTQHVAGPVHMLTGAGGNIGVSAGEDGILIIPFVDVASGGNAVGLRDSIGEVLDHLPADAQVIPGHGTLSTVDDLKTYHRMLEESIATVKAAKDAGKSVEEIQAAGLSDEWDGWGSGFINESVFIGFIFESL